MGLLVDGEWVDKWYDTQSHQGRFERQASTFRNWVTADGAPGPSGEGGFKAESGRYHLYVCYACPWAHRTLIYRALCGLTPHIDVSVVHPLMKENGWTFDADFDGATGDRLHGAAFLRDVYTAAEPRATTRVTVPVLWDKARGTIVSNESSEIILMLDEAFAPLVGRAPSMRPAAQAAEIDALNDEIYPNVNNGVYRCGFATTQTAYEEAFAALFATLDRLDARLRAQRYLVGAQPTEADWRLFTTLVRFDAVYVGHFKCNLRRIADYPALSGYLRDLYQYPGVRETVRMDHIKYHYYASHDRVNPSGVVPIGPELDLDAPHGRG